MFDNYLPSIELSFIIKTQYVRGKNMKKYVSLGIMITLLDYKKHTAPELAKKYETSVKTIYRSIENLLEAGMPIICIQGKGGGYQLISQSKINATFFTLSELSSFLSFIKSNSKNIPSEFKDIDAKINNIENKEISNKILSSLGNFVIDTDNWGSTSITDKNISLIKDCINNHTKIIVNYQNLNNTLSGRVIHPYCLVFKSGYWYVYAYCEERKSFRLFKLSRISKIENTNCIFIKQNIDLTEKPWNNNYKESFEKINIELECDINSIKDINTWLETSDNNLEICNQNNNQNINTKTISGTASFSLGLVHQIILYGNKIKVIKPTKLKEAIKTECLNIYKNYA